MGENLETYRSFPRMSGECGGKNFHLVHESADVESVSVATLRSAYEYSGQKCSACSRLYIPESMWPEVRDLLVSMSSQLKIASPLEFDTFTSAVIDERSFDRIAAYIDYGKANNNNKKSTKLIFGGTYDKSKGFYVQPTLFETSDPHDKLMKEEIFGPILTVYVYKANEYAKVVDLVDTTTPFALTGSIFCQDKTVLEETKQKLRNSCGNLYINDKSTGAGK